MKEYIGITGLVIGVIAVGMAIFQGNIRDVVSPPVPEVRDERSIKELAVEAGKKMLADKLREKQASPVPQPPSAPEKTGIFSGVSDKYDATALLGGVDSGEDRHRLMSYFLIHAHISPLDSHAGRVGRARFPGPGLWG